MGLARSVRGRVAEVGGRVEIDSVPGWGTEVRLWVPS
jgi:signal transduction histidine kinase